MCSRDENGRPGYVAEKGLCFGRLTDSKIWLSFGSQGWKSYSLVR